MSRRGLLWAGLVFSLTLLVQLPASWVALGLGLPMHAVSGSLWQGQAQQFGPVGPVRWALQPWRLQANAQLGFQGQGWQLHAEGWPWRWQLDVTAQDHQASVQTAYRLAGQWQGTLRLQGAGRQCRTSEGRITVTDLALSEPWSLGLGQGWVEMDCRTGLRLHGQLIQQREHRLALNADLLGRHAVVAAEMQPDAALTPLLRAARLVGPQALTGQREWRW
ncbi:MULTISPECIES: type II secretion system protein N [Pseudomonas]|jgi:general secretion pathway protein N|uniref:Type II secretion system protein N n=1 Tax=Pseudomonas putida (strain W619) TaxID=390235 RepID=B1JDF9_PSEPW|nr:MULTISPECIES: type II secretion system protein N [Pseudomonas]MDH1571549.1 type II secretion system protein N [Pseudomonas sp. GD03746]QQE83111.1 general secretion pathway protein GspN [Pseudomonas putida]UTL80256.1 type II secretion system protein N [Pseudomonas putida]HEN8712073.1 general secretion pathway protein GspN [Pseudomonas putida]HEN8717020.1 general secretion pathway protein GspN [Pseudomonas putida]